MKEMQKEAKSNQLLIIRKPPCLGVEPTSRTDIAEAFHGRRVD
jgi:hypothetical protein